MNPVPWYPIGKTATDGNNGKKQKCLVKIGSNMTVNGKEEYNATKLRKVTWELTTISNLCCLRSSRYRNAETAVKFLSLFMKSNVIHWSDYKHIAASGLVLLPPHQKGP